MTEQNVLVGKTIKAVYLDKEGDAIKFVLSDGTEVVARADGDCCSNTWIESVDNPEALIGTVQEADDAEGLQEDSEDGELKFYGFKIRTDKGHCTIDYRNSSNGYYGGNLTWSGDGHYGGVFNQNGKGTDWKLIGGTE